jgi:hypothetical protein
MLTTCSDGWFAVSWSQQVIHEISGLGLPVPVILLKLKIGLVGIGKNTYLLVVQIARYAVGIFTYQKFNGYAGKKSPEAME